MFLFITSIDAKKKVGCQASYIIFQRAVIKNHLVTTILSRIIRQLNLSNMNFEEDIDLVMYVKEAIYCAT